MDDSYLGIGTPRRTFESSAYQPKEPTFEAGKISLVVIGVFLIIGSGLATGLSYAKLGTMAYCCLSGAPLGIALIILGICCEKEEPSSIKPSSTRETPLLTPSVPAGTPCFMNRCPNKEIIFNNFTKHAAAIYLTSFGSKTAIVINTTLNTIGKEKALPQANQTFGTMPECSIVYLWDHSDSEPNRARTMSFILPHSITLNHKKNTTKLELTFEYSDELSDRIFIIDLSPEQGPHNQSFLKAT